MLSRRLILLIAVKKQLSSYALNIDGVKSRILQYLKVLMIMLKVEIETLDYILSQRTTRPIYMRVQVRLDAISPYQSTVITGNTRHHHLRPYETASSPAIRDYVSGHTRHRLQSFEAHLRLRPVYSIRHSVVMKK